MAVHLAAASRLVHAQTFAMTAVYSVLLHGFEAMLHKAAMLTQSPSKCSLSPRNATQSSQRHLQLLAVTCCVHPASELLSLTPVHSRCRAADAAMCTCREQEGG